MNTNTAAYPVAASYDSRSGLHHHGLATTAEEARDIYTKGMEPEDAASVPLPVLNSLECSHVAHGGRICQAMDKRGDAEIEASWSAEEAAYSTITNCSQWRKVVVTFWSFE